MCGAGPRRRQIDTKCQMPNDDDQAKGGVGSYQYEANVEPSLAKLQARLGLSEAQLQKVAMRS